MSANKRRSRPLSEPQRRTLQLLAGGGHILSAYFFTDAVDAQGVTMIWRSVGNTHKALLNAHLVAQDTVASEPGRRIFRINDRGRRALAQGTLDPEDEA